MPLRDFDGIRYMPILSVRPAEMTALEELPERDKDLLFPHILLRPWLGAHRLSNALARFESAYGTRPAAVEISPLDDDFSGNRRPVHDEIEALRVPANGYEAWCNFIETKPNYVPVLQYTDLSEFELQVQRFTDLGRGMVLRIPENALGRVQQLVGLLQDSVPTEELCIVLDYERQTRQFQTRQAACASIINSISNDFSGCHIAVSASSFPESFTGITSQSIYERVFFDGIIEQVGQEGMIYSDRGSARVERQSGGGGAPAPRIDLALASEWTFFREESDEEIEEERSDLYERAASRAVASNGWDPALRVWGTQMIEQTALGILGGIASPLKSTSVRINIHLHRQLFYGLGPDELHNTDEDWTD